MSYIEDACAPEWFPRNIVADAYPGDMNSVMTGIRIAMVTARHEPGGLPTTARTARQSTPGGDDHVGRSAAP
jgi:hypothetical protein